MRFVIDDSVPCKKQREMEYGLKKKKSGNSIFSSAGTSLVTSIIRNTRNKIKKKGRK